MPSFIPMPMSLREIARLPPDQWPGQVRVEPLGVGGVFDITVRPPGSKSLTNRALLLAALAKGSSTLTGALVDADDAQVMIAALRSLGTQIEITPEIEAGQPTANPTIRVHGVAGTWKTPPGATTRLDLHNAGTATRFLTAAAVLQPDHAGGIVIDGNARMRERPIRELVDALTCLGAQVAYEGASGFPPVRVLPGLGQNPRAVSFGRTSSSQFISALMLVAPFLPGGLQINFTTPPTSASYLRMTRQLLAQHGVRVDGQVGGTLVIPHQPVAGFDARIEPDASGASYFLAAAAICQSRVVIPGLSNLTSMQGDAGFAHCLLRAGAEAVPLDGATRIRGSASIAGSAWELHEMPDVAMTAAVVACFAHGPSTIRGLRTLRVKETDRIAALVAELTKLGVGVQVFSYTGPDGKPDEAITVTPPSNGIDCSPNAPAVLFETYDDHRMAMSLALIGLRRPNVVIDNPACVCKTYPTFWRDLARVYG